VALIKAGLAIVGAISPIVRPPNFGPTMAMAADLTIITGTPYRKRGEIPPDQVVTPDLY
jgi:acyl CoA:acetate/3-ketoacid CoA transferase alpha subunit